MYVVKKNYIYDLKEVKNLYQIPEMISKKLKRMYSNNSLQRKQDPELIEYLLQIKNSNNWIKCDCNNDVQNPVIMTICQKDETIYFSKVHSFCDHHIRCVFYRENTNISKNNLEYIRERKNIEFFGMYKNSDEISLNKSITNHDSKNTRSDIGKLGRRLFTLVEESGLNCYKDEYFLQSSANQEAKNIKEIENLVSKNHIVPNIKLSECFLFKHKISFKDLYTVYDNIKNLHFKWPENYKKHGYILFTTDKIDKVEKAINIAGDNILNLSGSIKFINGVIEKSEDAGPYLVLMSVLHNSKRKSQFEVYDAFAAPILSRDILIPIESNFERIVLNKIIYAFKMLKIKNKNSNFSITKPLFDIEIFNERCRPDFIIDMDSKKFIIEVMGFENDEYLERKERTHHIMKNIAPIICFDCKSYSNKSIFQEDLDILVKDLYTKFYKK